MDDFAIIDLYFDRSEQAIVETDVKYGGYCFPSPTISFQTMKIRKSVSAILIWLHGNRSHPGSPDLSAPFWGNSHVIYPLTVGERAARRKEAAGKSFLLWRNWKTV